MSCSLTDAGWHNSTVKHIFPWHIPVSERQSALVEKPTSVSAEPQHQVDAELEWPTVSTPAGWCWGFSRPGRGGNGWKEGILRGHSYASSCTWKHNMGLFSSVPTKEQVKIRGDPLPPTELDMGWGIIFLWGSVLLPRGDSGSCPDSSGCSRGNFDTTTPCGSNGTQDWAASQFIK